MLEKEKAMEVNNMTKYKNNGKEPIGRAIGRNGYFRVYAIRFDVIKPHVYVEVKGIKGTILNAGVIIQIGVFAKACKMFLESIGYSVVKKSITNE
jgi:hypothetical protein